MKKNKVIWYLLTLFLLTTTLNTFSQTKSFKNSIYQFDYLSNFQILKQNSENVFLKSVSEDEIADFESFVYLSLLSDDIKKEKINTIADVANLEIIEIVEFEQTYTEEDNIEHLSSIGEFDTYIRSSQEAEYDNKFDKNLQKIRLSVTYYFISDIKLYGVTYINKMTPKNVFKNDRYILMKLFQKKTNTEIISLIFNSLKVK